jgi:hypothetical protein
MSASPSFRNLSLHLHDPLTLLWKPSRQVCDCRGSCGKVLSARQRLRHRQRENPFATIHIIAPSVECVHNPDEEDPNDHTNAAWDEDTDSGDDVTYPQPVIWITADGEHQGGRVPDWIDEDEEEGPVEGAMQQSDADAPTAQPLDIEMEDGASEPGSDADEDEATAYLHLHFDADATRMLYKTCEC